jgi:uncharacterized protein (TIGR00299 family) protein
MAWFHCFAGVAGDMALGSLLDAGAPPDEVRSLLGRLPFGGWQLDVEPVLRGGVAATRAVVSAEDDVVVRTYRHIVGLVEEARLPRRVADRSLAVFASLARVESSLHRRPVEQVHFHEVGGHDTIVDVVGTCAALEVLGIDEVRASPVATGLGMVRSAHGLLPNPAPAVVALLAGVPTWGRDTPVELTTSGYGPLPAMTVEAQGFGAGRRELDELPNATQVVVGSAVSAGGDATVPGGNQVGAGQPVVTLEATVDDATGEELAHAVGVLLHEGAHDAWITPVVMKKGRPGHVVTVLCDPAGSPHLRDVVRRTTGSLGVRAVDGSRWPAARRFEHVEVDGHPVRVKVSSASVKAEHDDAVVVAGRTGQTVRTVARRAEEAWRRLHDQGAGESPDGRVVGPSPWSGSD